jgi:hypothetical protein
VSVAPAPWTCRCQAIVWFGRAPGRAAANALPGPLAGRRALGVVGGIVRYLDTPVGPYDEVFAAIGVRHGRGVAGHIPFMAVDSEDSVAGGRGNWALPKTLASFDGDLGAIEVHADGWRVDVRTRAVGPALPTHSTGINLQVWPDGALRASKLRLRGRMRPALVTVGSDHPLVTSGRHPGAVLAEATFVLGVPRESA